MDDTVLESFFLIRDTSNKKYLKFTTQSKKQLEFELEIEARGSFYADGVFGADYKQAVRIVDLVKAEEMFCWLNSINSAKYELLKVCVNANRIS